MNKSKQQTISIAIQARLTVLLWGEPGVGKTAFIQGLAARLGVPAIPILACLRDPTDFGGLPFPKENHFTYLPPEWAYKVSRMPTNDLGLSAILFFDELSTAREAVQAALLTLLLERRAGDFQLPDSVAFLAAANPPESNQAAIELLAPLANRVLHVDWNIDIEYLRIGFTTGWPKPDVPLIKVSGFPERVRKYHSLIASFWQRRPDLVHKRPHNEVEASRAWPSPRTWEFAARYLAAWEGSGASQDAQALGVQGLVGEGAALEFLGWLEELDLPDPGQVLFGKAKLPTRNDQLHAVISSVVAYIASQPQQQTWEAGWQFARRLAQTHRDLAFLVVRSLKKIGDERNYEQWQYLEEFLPLLEAAGLI